MSDIDGIFTRIYNLIHKDGQCDVIALLKFNQCDVTKAKVNYQLIKDFLLNIFKEVDELAAKIKEDNTILVSVRNQKLLRTCFQIITSFGFSQCFIPGLGINFAKRCSSTAVLANISLTDDQKYELLVACTDFFTRSYEIPVLKNIIITLHMSDYLAALIQLSFAPLKKPGTYNNFVMTKEIYGTLMVEKQKYIAVYEHLVNNCFQPILMKELLVLQSGTNPSPPTFVKRVIAKEMSRRLLTPGGLLSLIRCFIECYSIDTGFEWKKIDMICRIITAKHGNSSEDLYLQNICSQLTQILTLNDTSILATAVACVLRLKECYQHSDTVQSLVNNIFQAFDADYINKLNLPGTVVLSHREIENKVNILHSCCTVLCECPIAYLAPNLYILFLLAVKNNKNDTLKIKLKEIIFKALELLNNNQVMKLMKTFLFGNSDLKIDVEEYEAGVTIKCLSVPQKHCMNDATRYLMGLIKDCTNITTVQKIFKTLLNILSELWTKRISINKNEEKIMEDIDIFYDVDEQYAHILHTLTELAACPSVETGLKQNPAIVLDFIELTLYNQTDPDDECTTISLVYLNTALIPSLEDKDVNLRLRKLVPALKKLSETESVVNSDLCKEALSLISSKNCKQFDSRCERAVTDIFDPLLPVRAHGIIELTKLVDGKDPEAISKKHYIFCILQTQLKDADTYIYLSAINGIAALGTHCSEDVLNVLCKEFLQIHANEMKQEIETTIDLKRKSETRMKIGDIIVKVTKRLGEMAIVHKTVLLNTMLSGCRDVDPLIRTSALSNLAEIVLVLHYKVGTILYEILHCVHHVIENDLAIECRRAAVMVISSLIRGLGHETLQSNKDYILPIYRTLKKLYRDEGEDSVVRLHAQIALEELDDIVKQFLFPEVKMQKQIYVLDKPNEDFK